MKKLHTEVSKCYLIQVLDNDGYEVYSEYRFCNRKSYAELVAKQLAEELEAIRYEQNIDIC